ncbi:Cathepsin L [Cleaved into: Cathepsin L heavy chain, partial [Durusdinium trenchii]
DQLEEDVRRDAFERRMRWVLQRNRELEAQGRAFRVGGGNILAGLTEDELESLTGQFDASETEQLVADEEGGSIPDISGSGNGIGKLGADGLPVSIDWRFTGAVSDVKSQGRCGACWAFAATGAMESAFFLRSGILVSLSEDQLLECDSDPFQKACVGGNFYYSLKYLSSNAATTSRDYAYSYTSGRSLDGDLSCLAGTAGVPGVIRGSSSSGGVIFVARNEAALKAAVARQPVAVAINGYVDEFKFYESGVLDSPSCDENVDHAVLVVGYGTTLEGEDFWLVRNSWGFGWGSQGYIKVARNTNAKFGMCGITKQANFPSGASCAVSDCSLFRDRQFCTVEQGCLNSTQEILEDQWFVPNSTFVFVDGRPELPVEKLLNTAAIVLSVLTVLLLALMAQNRIAILRAANQRLNCRNFWARSEDLRRQIQAAAAAANRRRTTMMMGFSQRHLHKQAGEDAAARATERFGGKARPSVVGAKIVTAGAQVAKRGKSIMVTSKDKVGQWTTAAKASAQNRFKPTRPSDTSTLTNATYLHSFRSEDVEPGIAGLGDPGDVESGQEMQVEEEEEEREEGEGHEVEEVHESYDSCACTTEDEESVRQASVGQNDHEATSETQSQGGNSQASLDWIFDSVREFLDSGDTTP